MAKIDPKTLDLKEKLVSMNRVAKTVKGGRTMRMAALVVVGDGNGHVGVGLGKAVEFQEAIRKATEDAKKNIVCVSTCGISPPERPSTLTFSSKGISPTIRYNLFSGVSSAHNNS